MRSAACQPLARKFYSTWCPLTRKFYSTGVHLLVSFTPRGFHLLESSTPRGAWESFHDCRRRMQLHVDALRFLY